MEHTRFNNREWKQHILLKVLTIIIFGLLNIFSMKEASIFYKQKPWHKARDNEGIELQAAWTEKIASGHKECQGKTYPNTSAVWIALGDVTTSNPCTQEGISKIDVFFLFVSYCISN